jgi:uncharacterized damage-inducible protein DinB
MKKQILALLALLPLLVLAAPAIAQEGAGDDGLDASMTALLRNIDGTGKKLVSLAEAIPADKYAWRPSEGVRSTSEVFMHVASAHYFFAGMLGVDTPEGIDPQKLEEITDKDKVVEILKASLVHIDGALRGVEDMGAPMKVFGQDASVADLVYIALGHLHEHLGQAIAYARSNEIKPPWSR